MRFNLYVTRFFIFTLSTLLVTSFFLVACSDDDDDGDSAQFDAATTLNDFANTVVLATYTDLDNKAGTLLNTVRALQSSTTQANLEERRPLGKPHDGLGNRAKPSCSAPLTPRDSTRHLTVGPSIG